MTKALFIAILFLTSTLYPKNLVDSVTFGIGQSKDGISIYRVGLRESFNFKLLQNSIGYFSGYYELSVNYWSLQKDYNLGVALSPVFGYYLYLGNLKPYVECGVGISYWSRVYIKNRNLGSNYLFEDRVGFGIKYKNLDLSFRYMHYSNGGIKKTNMGIDIFIGSISYKF